jgi:hypothetical protein
MLFPSVHTAKFSISDIEPHDVPQRLHAVFPSDFHSLFERPPGIADRHFINSPVALGDFRCDLRLELESVRFQLNVFQHFAPENLVAGFHVRKLLVGANTSGVDRLYLEHILSCTITAL